MKRTNYFFEGQQGAVKASFVQKLSETLAEKLIIWMQITFGTQSV